MVFAACERIGGLVAGERAWMVIVMTFCDFVKGNIKGITRDVLSIEEKQM